MFALSVPPQIANDCVAGTGCWTQKLLAERRSTFLTPGIASRSCTPPLVHICN